MTSTLDMVLTAAILLVLVRALLRDPRWWLAAGGLVGVALYNKHLVVLTLISIGAALAIVGPRRVLWSRWLLTGVGIALVVGAPNVLYQVANDWPQLEMARAIERNKGEESRILFLPLQLATVGVFLAPVVPRRVRPPAEGPRAATRACRGGGLPSPEPAGHRDRGTAVLHRRARRGALRGRVRPDRWVDLRAPGAADCRCRRVRCECRRLRRVRPAPAACHHPRHDPDRRHQPGDQRPDRVAGLRPADHRCARRPPCRRVTSGGHHHGQLRRGGGAGSLRPPGLPPVTSGHNELWSRAMPPAGAHVVVAVGFPDGSLDDVFESCEVAGILDNGADIPNEEQGLPIQVCRGPVTPWTQLWPSFRHFD